MHTSPKPTITPHTQRAAFRQSRLHELELLSAEGIATPAQEAEMRRLRTVAIREGETV